MTRTSVFDHDYADWQLSHNHGLHERVRVDGCPDLTVQVPSKKRKRPLAPTASAVHRSKDGLGPYEDALDSPLLTPRVWEQLVSIHHPPL
jgi:hypothetical protein